MRPTILVTVDVESDNLWAGLAQVTFDNIRQIQRLHSFFERNQVVPTYLVTYPVATSKEGRSAFSPIVQSAAAEIGSHMHVWTTPPLRPLTAEDHRYCPLATEISEDLLREKMEAVTSVVGELAGQAPRSHRAGRYGLDGRGLRVLQELGYVADTSVTPLLDWKEPSHSGGWRGPDFRNAPLHPYFPSYNDVSVAGESRILEVPVSFFLSRPLPRGMALRMARWPRNNNLLRALRWTRLVRHAWLRPGRDVDGKTLIGVASALLAAGVPVLNVMFHSSEMAAGTSPHTPSQSNVEESYAQLEMLFRYLVREGGAEPATLSGFAAAHAVSVPRVGLAERALTEAVVSREG